MHQLQDDLLNSVWKTMDKKELERQYSPSRWSKRYLEDEILKVHLEITKKKSAEAQNKIPCQRNIAYADGDRTKLDVFGEDLPNDSYILMYFHGGYWQELEKDLSAYPVEPLYRNGVVTVIVGYTLAPQAHMSQIVEEIRKSVIWTNKLAKKRGSKGIVLMGHSAGGHLITQVLSTFQDGDKEMKESLLGFIALAGIFDVRPLVSTYVNDPLQLDEKTAWDLSPLSRVQSLALNFPKIKALIVDGSEDTPEFKRQSQQYCELLKTNHIDASYVEIKDADHFNLVEDLSLPGLSLNKRIEEFFSTLKKQ